MSWTELFRPSGGIYYHARALLHRGRWREFKAQVGQWLEEWRPAQHRRPELLLLGPSAGYTLPSSWLRGYDRIIAVDVDPLASYLFRRLHADCSVQFVSKNLFWRQGRLTLEPLKNLFNDHPHADILFCNVLGQVLLEGRVSEEEWQTFLMDLRQLLNGRIWASYHDLRSSYDGEEIDHLMATPWSANLPRRDTTWQVNPSRIHNIEFIFSS